MFYLCNKTKTEYESFKTLQQEFVAVCEKIRAGDTSGEFVHAKALKAKLEKARDALFFFPYPRELKTVIKKENYQEIEIVWGYTEPVNTLQVMFNGCIVTSDEYGVFTILSKNKDDWRIESFGGARRSVPHVLSDGRIISSEDNGVVTIWSKKEDTWVENIFCKNSLASVFQMLPDGRVVSGDLHGEITIWDEGKDAWIPSESFKNNSNKDEHGSPVNTLQVLSDGRIVSGSRDGIIRIWDKKEGVWEIIGILKDEDAENAHGDSSVNTLQVLSDGSIVSGSSDGIIRVWRKNHDKEEWEAKKIRGHTKSVNTLQVLPNGRIVSGSSDATIQILGGKDGDNVVERIENRYHYNPDDDMYDPDYDPDYDNGGLQYSKDPGVKTIQVLSDGRIVSLGFDGIIRIWDGEKV